MTIGKVVGTVVGSSRNDGLTGPRYLLIERCNQKGETKGEFLIALDTLGAAKQELVMVTEGSPSRETPDTVNKPVDALVVGIIDLIDEVDTVVYRK